MQTVINLSHNGVPDNSFNSLIKKELEALIEPLTQWNDPHAMLAVAKAVEQAGHITGSRLQRVAGGSTKALGLSRDFHRDEADADRYGGDEGDDILPGADQIYSGRDLGSGAPLSLFENAYELILAGFHPLTFPPLYEKMHKIVINVIDACVKSFHIPVSESVEAFIIPGRVSLPLR
jgi:RNA-dependent RNA polymerase